MVWKYPGYFGRISTYVTRAAIADVARTSDLSDVRIGVYWDYARDSTESVFQVHRAVCSVLCFPLRSLLIVLLQTFELFILQLKQRGAVIQDIAIPNLTVMTKAHMISIAGLLRLFLFEGVFTRHLTKHNMSLFRQPNSPLRYHCTRSVGFRWIPEWF